MVKPVYPHKKHPTVPSNVIWDLPRDSEAPISDDEVEGAVGYSFSSSQMRVDDFFHGSENDVFRFQDSEVPITPSMRTLSCSLNNGQIFQCAPVPAPRERFSSLPDRDMDHRQFDPNTSPVPKERRKSAPSQSSSHGHSTDLPPALKDIATKGQELFWFILSEEVKVREVENPGSLSALTIPTSHQRMEVLNERGQYGGRTLRQIAETFAHSAQRIRVRDFAEQIDLQSLNYDSFSDLLFGLFQDGGLTQARVLVLFYFCADVALRALRERFTYRFQQLVDWTSRYITERLSGWVFEHGGWAAVLQESVDQALKVTLLGLCCVGILACSIIILHRFQH